MAQTYVPTWRIIVAFVFDLITETGFQLDGWPALLSFALIIAYFVVGSRTGGTLWARLLGAVRNR